MEGAEFLNTHSRSAAKEQYSNSIGLSQRESLTYSVKDVLCLQIETLLTFRMDVFSTASKSPAVL